MQISEAGLALIRRSEGKSLKAYPDCGSLAIAYGHHGPEVTETSVWTDQQCEDTLLMDTARNDRQMAAVIKTPFTQGQWDALADWWYEYGPGHFEGSLLEKAIANGQLAAIPGLLYRLDPDGNPHGWVFIERHGVMVPDDALIARRQEEIALWNS